MTRGILLFAFQSSFDYISLTIKTATRLKHYIDLPISVVTDSAELLESSGLFDQIITVTDDATQKKRFYNGSTDYVMHEWKNSNRVMCYELSPYDHTLVMDTDYIINSNFLLNCLDIDSDFLIFKNSCDLAGWRNTQEFQYINQFSISFYWATVFSFKKTKQNKIFFELVKTIRDNWDYYRLLYQILEPNFRNDFAFSIAIHILGDDFKTTFPGKIYYTKDRDFLIDSTNSSCAFLVEKQNCHGEYTPIKVNNLDVHVMNKTSIMDIL